MKIAVIGSGISGLTAARCLAVNHSVTVFEAASHIGGHVNTVPVKLDGVEYEIDTGFIVYNERTYPNFAGLLSELGVETLPTPMSFSVQCERTGIEYNGTSINGIFAQRRNLASPSFLRMLLNILRFNHQGVRDLHTVSDDQTVSDYLAEKGYSQPFAEHYLLPMGAAIWSCPTRQFEDFPIRFILEFYHNHGLLQLRDRPQWRVIAGGSRRYVDRMVEPFRNRIRLNCPVLAVSRNQHHVTIVLRDGKDVFDEVIFACHSDQSLKLLTDADPLEQELLSAFPYSTSIATLHTDSTVLPRSKRAWASWNYHVSKVNELRPTLTYHMNRLQQIQSEHNFCVTLNEDHRIDPRKVISSFVYSHPIFTTNRSRVQSRHSELIRRRRTSYCGAYWRNGFHEDGMVSAMAVCDAFATAAQPASIDTGETIAC